MTCRFCLGTRAMAVMRPGGENAGGRAGWVAVDLEVTFCFREWLGYNVRYCHKMT